MVQRAIARLTRSTGPDGRLSHAAIVLGKFGGSQAVGAVHFDNYETQRNIQNILQNDRSDSTPRKGAVMHPRLFARVRPTGKISNKARIIIGPKAPVIDCTIVDYSAGGACLEVFGQPKLPNRFELLFGAAKKRCRVVWSVGRRLGVVF